jgi:HlyD family secretion protein
MIRTWFFLGLALIGIGFAIYTVRTGSKPIVPAPPIDQPARAPFEAYVAGNGLIEPSTEDIAIGATVPGMVIRVQVKPGDEVKGGDPLFTVDDRRERAELEVRKASLEAARQSLARLQSLPRPEELPAFDARVAEFSALVKDSESQLSFFESVGDQRAISAEELSRRRFAVMAAQSKLKAAESDLTLLKAGAWKPDLAIAQANVASAEAQVKATETDIDRLTVRAPVDATVLQVKIRAGEYAQAGALQTPLMLLGATKMLHVRVNVDENDAWRVEPGSPAEASVRGNSQLKTPLEFVRIEPYVVPKRSLTGESTERVDTRVLQVIYAFKPGTIPVYVGQQMDVFIQAKAIVSRGTASISSTTPGGIN